MDEVRRVSYLIAFVAIILWYNWTRTSLYVNIDSSVPVRQMQTGKGIADSIDWVRNEETGEIEKSQTNKPLLAYPRHSNKSNGNDR